MNSNLVRDTSIDIFCHLMNCCNTMGSGIGLQIGNAYPEVASESYKRWNASRPELLIGKNLYIPTHDGRACVIMYALWGFTPSRLQFLYEAFRSCISRLEKKLNVSDPLLKVGFPYGLGSGTGGGSWPITYKTLHDLAENVPQDIYIVGKEGIIT